MKAEARQRYNNNNNYCFHTEKVRFYLKREIKLEKRSLKGGVSPPPKLLLQFKGGHEKRGGGVGG